jgi:hypothetical protein
MVLQTVEGKVDRARSAPTKIIAGADPGCRRRLTGWLQSQVVE